MYVAMAGAFGAPDHSVDAASGEQADPPRASIDPLEFTDRGHRDDAIKAGMGAVLELPTGIAVPDGGRRGRPETSALLRHPRIANAIGDGMKTDDRPPSVDGFRQRCLPARDDRTVFEHMADFGRTAIDELGDWMRRGYIGQPAMWRPADPQ